MYYPTNRLNSILRKRLVRILRQRAFQAYCVGAPRTGTTSVFGLFSYYRSGHEVNSEELLKVSLDYQEGKIEQDTLEEYVLIRDNTLCLEMDSSAHNYYIIPILLQLFPNAKFLIPMRDCVSWLDSYINYGINNFQQNKRTSLQRMRMGLHRYGELWRHYSPGEDILRDLDIPSVEALLHYYEQYNESILDWIPANRRLIYRSAELEKILPQIAGFLSIPLSSLRLSLLHMNKTTARHHVLTRLDPHFLREKIEFYCGSLMAEYFPEVDLDIALEKYVR